MKQVLHRVLPKSLFQLYHWSLARIAAARYRHPSRRLIVIGVTGTKGKSTTVTLISRVLEQAGYTIGVIATTHFKIGKREWVNETKQTMPGRFRLQRLLQDMVYRGCHYAIIETSSEGIAQFRSAGIEYDIAVFTNISPEHIESHGSFEKYRDAKLTLFRSLMTTLHKRINGSIIPKVIVANADDPAVGLFLEPRADRRYTYSLELEHEPPSESDIHTSAHHIKLMHDHTEFVIDHQLFRTWMLGRFNVSNCLAALSIGLSQGVALPVIKEALESDVQIPGRLEEIPNHRDIRVFVDYAHEPASLEAVYQVVMALKPKRLIAVLGSQGGGRDTAKRPIMGRLAGQYADYVIITNEDPYDEDPHQIIDDVAAGAIESGKQLDTNCFKILDRRTALGAALNLAQAGDIVIATGKGSETVMAVEGGRLIPWDDREALRELLFSI